jgi:hypothetical protein
MPEGGEDSTLFLCAPYCTTLHTQLPRSDHYLPLPYLELPPLPASTLRKACIPPIPTREAYVGARNDVGMG